MAQLIVRNLEDDVRDKLRERAFSHGRSMEEEVRDILRAAVVHGATQQNAPGLGSRIAQRFSDCPIDDDFQIPEWRGTVPQPATFE